jgi:hypothetical protein
MASKRRLRRKSCDGKIKYATQKDANIGLSKYYMKLKSPMRAYKCKFCKKFHLGHYINKMYTDKV